jgi:hypothetical protein
MPKLIPITTWAARTYDPPPSIHTLRKWAREGRISPAPQLAGREYRVMEDAVYVQAARLRPRLPKITVLESDDPVVQAILNSGKTPQPKPARPAG